MLELDGVGASVQLDSALVLTSNSIAASPALTLGEVFSSLLLSDRTDGLFPTLVVDEQGVALGLVYSSKESVQAAMAQRKGTR